VARSVGTGRAEFVAVYLLIVNVLIPDFSDRMVEQTTTP